MKPVVSESVQSHLSGPFFCLPIDILVLNGTDKPTFMYHVIWQERVTEEIRLLNAFMFDSLIVLAHLCDFLVQRLYDEDQVLNYSHKILTDIQAFIRDGAFQSYTNVLLKLHESVSAHL